MINGLAEKRILILIKKDETKIYFAAKIIKRYRIDPFLCANKTCLIRLRYHKRFGGKTEFKFN
jgi:hypothetical protein